MKKLYSPLYLILFILPLLGLGQNDPRWHYYRAMDLKNNGNLHGALEELNLTIAAQPHFSKAYGQRAKVKLLLHQFEEASKDHYKALELNAEYANSYSNYAPLHALSELHKGFKYDTSHVERATSNVEYEKGLQELDLKIARNSLDLLALLDRSYLKLAHNQLIEAEQDALLALAIDSANLYTSYLLGLISEKANEYDKAISYYGNCIFGEPSFYLNYWKRGMVYLQQGNLAAAEKDISIAARLNDRSAEIFYNLSLIYMLSDNNEYALLNLNNALVINPFFPEAYFNRAFLKKKLRDYSGAIADYTAYLRLNPNDALAYNNRANVLMLQGQYVKAKEDYTRALELDPQLSMAFLNRGISGIMRGDRDEACHDFNSSAMLGNTAASKKQFLHCY